MTDQSAQEPTMEEILASIRRIISEDEAPAETAAAPAEAAPAAEEAPSPALMDETPSMQTPEPADDEVLELTDRYDAPTESIGDLDVAPRAEPEPEPLPQAPAPVSYEPEPPRAPEPAPAAAAASSSDSLVGAATAGAAASAFAGLGASLPRTSASGPSIDDLARELLRPMLKEWLDANLAGIVEAQVRKEVERIARNAG